MATKRLGTKPRTPLLPEQKVAFGLLMFLGIGGVYFGFQSFGTNLMRPINNQIAEFYTGESFLTEDERDSRELEESKTKDTDGDGLVDYDELYVYKTSPYISDSDSDGYSDREEVFSNNDPNCPIGESCGLVASTEDVADTGVASANALIAGIGADGAVDAGSVEFDSPEAVEAFFKQATLDEIRSALIEAGMTQEELDTIDDETLEAFFNGALEEAALSGNLDDFVGATE
jgi:hypothetical protein